MKESSPKMLTIPIRITLVLLLYGFLFIMMNWPFGHNILIISSVILTILYTVRFLGKKNKVLLDYVKLSIVLVWTSGLLGQILNLFHNDTIILIILIILTVWWLIEEGFTFLIHRKLKENRFIKVVYYTVLSFSVVLISFGYIFKIQHWPYGALMFTLGMLFLSVLLIIDLFAVKNK